MIVVKFALRSVIPSQSENQFYTAEVIKVSCNYWIFFSNLSIIVIIMNISVFLFGKMGVLG